MKISLIRVFRDVRSISLQALENFEGILIAATDLTCNLDRAFERKFTFRVLNRKISLYETLTASGSKDHGFTGRKRVGY